MEAEELLKDVLAVTRDAGFNRVRYIGQLMSQEEQAEFLKGLFNQAVQAREAKSGEALFDYLEAWEEKGMAIVAGRAQSPIELDATPWTPAARTHPRGQGRPRDDRRLLPQDPAALRDRRPRESGRLVLPRHPAHDGGGRDGRGPPPLRPLRPSRGPQLRLPHRPRRGDCTPRASSAASTTPTTPSWASSMRPELLAAETAPEVARLLKADGVDAAVITAT